ncbi:MAG: Scr1 family TA system antitoxin-like transcriptional regulator [Pseudonocardiaceae bacterium]
MAGLPDEAAQLPVPAPSAAFLVPGLPQTGEYARAVISRNLNVPSDEVDDRVAARLARQNLFSRDRPRDRGPRLPPVYGVAAPRCSTRYCG